MEPSPVVWGFLVRSFLYRRNPNLKRPPSAEGRVCQGAWALPWVAKQEELAEDRRPLVTDAIRA